MMTSNTFSVLLSITFLAGTQSAEVADALAAPPESSGIISDIYALLEPMWVELIMVSLATFVYLLMCTDRALITRAKKPAKLFQCDVVKASTKVGAPEDRRPGKLERKVAAEAGSGSPQSERAAAAQLHVVKQAKQISMAGKAGNLQEALNLFRAVKESQTTQLTSLVYNCLLDACVQCDDLPAALRYLEETKAADLADVVSYNTVMKGHLAKGQTKAVQLLLAEMAQRGIQPTRIAYHCLLNALVQNGDTRGIWSCIEQMGSDGLPPNVVTCSILLKTVGSRSHAHELDRLMKLVDSLEGTMDEVLFASVVEACIRTGRLDLLSERTKQYARSGGLLNVSAPIYGSMIKAYGQAHDLDRIWELWTEMQTRKVIPTAITLGCMVEALVMNKSAEDAWQLINDVWADEAQRSAVNTVVYSTIIKGFAMTKQHAKITALYDQMKERGIPRNTITFNTMLNALARCGFMERVPQVLVEMQSAEPPVLPDIVTYSTIVKGYCICGQLDKALPLLVEMKKDARLVPDEVTYNSLLDGCARQRRLEDALWLLDDMKASGVKPSNYTLSIVLKLLGRARRLNQAFAMVDSFSEEHGFKPNIQVYTCLIQACFHNKQTDKALELHDRIVGEGCALDAKTYTVLAKGCLLAGDLAKAERVVRCAYHLPDHSLAETRGAACGLDAACLEEVLEAMGPDSTAARSLRERIIRSPSKFYN